MSRDVSERGSRFLRRSVVLLAGTLVALVAGLLALSNALGAFDAARDGDLVDAGPAATVAPDEAVEEAADREVADPDADVLGTAEVDELVAEDEVGAVRRDLYQDRDPFAPVVVAPTAVTGAGEAESVPAPVLDPDPETGTDADPVGAPAPEPSPASSPSPAATPDPSCRTEPEVVCDGHYVALSSVGRHADGRASAVIQVDTSIHEAVVGDVLPGGFEVRAITGSCVELRHAGDEVRLCEGERTLK